MHSCVNCNKIVGNIQRVTLAGDPVCPYCGHASTSDFHHVWLCEECGEVSANPVGQSRPKCEDCGHVMSLVESRDLSIVRGVGTGDEDLELGLAILMEMQIQEI